MRNLKELAKDYWIPLTIMISCWVVSAAIMYGGVNP